MSKTALGQALGQDEVRGRLIPALAQGLQSTYVRREKREISGPGGATNAPGPGTQGTSLRCERDGTDVGRSGSRRRLVLGASIERRGIVPGTVTTIDRDQREGLYELVRNHLGSIEDFWVALERAKDFAKAEGLSLELAEDFRLLQDIGWGETTSARRST